MRPEDLARVDDLFHAALERSSDDRAGFLAEACPDDPAVRAGVDALLASHEAASGYFENLADRIATTVDLEVTAREQRRVGPYRTLRVIGRGGMGTVFLAERADGQFDQQVALKLIRLGMDSEEGVRRFLAERQIVARLEHPNIARLLDGGLTEDGRPYFVMELVDGRPLTAYCDSGTLSIDRRIELLIAAGEAVQYAHQNLVVHRDVKPSNILVTVDGAVKLVDFGIAKLLDAEVAPAPDQPLTRTGERVLTVPYAAPEQLAGTPITTATDVYALGVVLYELLTGRRPHETGGADAREIERAILEREPERPSAAIDRLARSGHDPSGEREVDRIAAARSTRPERLRRRLAGDLDTICLMALRKEPDRRYQSAGQFVDDLRRHRRGLPVIARPDTVGYRAAKFVRRHAVGVAATAAILALVVGLAGVTAIQSARTARERDKAQQVADLLVRLFEVADPSEARGTTITAREVLDRGVERIHSELREQAELKAALLSVMGRVYQNLGLYGRAAPLVEQSLALRRHTLGPSHRDVAEGLNALGEVLRLRGDYQAAEPVLRDALVLNQQVHGDDAPETARTRNNLSKLLYARGKNDEAEALARRALAANRARLGAEHVEVGESLMNVGAALFAKGNDKEAEPLFREALAIRRKALGPDHPLVPAALNNLAALLSRKGDFVAAEAAHRESLEIYRHVFGAEHPRVATSLNNLALVLYARSDHAAAEPLFRESLAMRRKLLDPSHAETAQGLANLGLLLQTTGRLEEAEPLYREALAIRRAALGEKHPLVAQIINNLGLLLQARGELDAAEPLFRQSLDLLRGQLGPGHPLVATNLHNLATLVRAKGDARAAEPLYREALDIRRKALPAGHPETTLTLVGLGTLLTERGDAANAEPLLVSAYEALRAQSNVGQETRTRTTDTLRALVRVYEGLGNDEKAKDYRAALAAALPPPNAAR